jgi:hypothetical protein
MGLTFFSVQTADDIITYVSGVISFSIYAQWSDDETYGSLKEVPLDLYYLNTVCLF